MCILTRTCMPMCIYHNTQVNSNEELLNRVEFAIPAFHAFCHVPACQVSLYAGTLHTHYSCPFCIIGAV